MNLRALTLAALALLPAAPASADAVAAGRVEARLLGEVEAVRPGAPFWVALRLRMAEGWHTYWRNPGDSGLATTIEWTLPAGFEASEIVWPHPERLPFGPLVNYGYEGEVGLLTRITPPADLAAGEPVTLAARADWLVCAEICIPEGADLALTLPVTAGEPPVDGRWAEDFAAARRALPVPSPWPATFAADGDSLTLHVAAPGLDAGRIADLWFYPLEPGLIDHAAPQEGGIGAGGLTLATARAAGAEPVSGTVDGVLVMEERLDDGGTVRQAFAVSAQAGAIPAGLAATLGPTPGIGLPRAVLFALLGGLILNLMPCVFPVLSMKALGLVRHAAGEPAAVRRHGLAYTGGVLACFGLIAGALIALKGAGAAVGWGFQLQSPVVVALLAYLMFALGLNLSGALGVGGGGLVGIGGGLASRGGYAGSFFTGALAAVVATPCTAPFMAAALGFAIVQPWYVALAVFLALGLGMALPYLALCFSPALLRFLPRPGPWMERFRQFLAFPLYATAAWLVWVLSLQVGPEGVAAALAGMVLIAFAAWLYAATRESTGFWRPAGALGAAAAVVLALGLVRLPAGTGPAVTAVRPAAAEGGPAWEPFSPQRLAELRAGGAPVFVNMTAAWCITCLVNERVALASPEVAAAFADRGVAYLKGDWTNGDPAITAVLDSFGRTGVPLYVLYPPEGASWEPVVLPQLLTEARLMRELDRLEQVRTPEGGLALSAKPRG